ncbi:hypothetical protein E2320_017994 [Naja naja]|nr:hypothetical protein E2320_017994 [Naja naja]
MREGRETPGLWARVRRSEVAPEKRRAPVNPGCGRVIGAPVGWLATLAGTVVSPGSSAQTIRMTPGAELFGGGSLSPLNFSLNVRNRGSICPTSRPISGLNA